MTAYKCDRCGKYFDNKERFKNFKVGGWSIISLAFKTTNDGRFDFEFCPKCAESFKN